MDRTLYISVIGEGDIENPDLATIAEEIGGEIAKRGFVLVCGGLGGVMDAAAKGAKNQGGESIGILPQDNRESASPHLSYSIPTGFGHGRNFLVALSGDGIISVGGKHGTISEIGFSLKLNKPLVIINPDNKEFLSKIPPPAVYASSALQAVALLEKMITEVKARS